MAPGLGRLPFTAFVARWLARRRFPTLFVIAAAALFLDVLLPDGLPLLDELLLAVATALLGAWRRRSGPAEDPEGPASSAPAQAPASTSGAARHGP
jgi:hypothetical protein